MSENEARERNERLARAMGWKWVARRVSRESDVWMRFLAPPGFEIRAGQSHSDRLATGDEEMFADGLDDLPCFDQDTPEGHWWKAKLVEWISQQDYAVKSAFWHWIEMATSGRCSGDTVPDARLSIMLATPEQVARAADEAIKEAGQDG